MLLFHCQNKAVRYGDTYFLFTLLPKQSNGQGGARAVDLAYPGVAPPLQFSWLYHNQADPDSVSVDNRVWREPTASWGRALGIGLGAKPPKAEQSRISNNFVCNSACISVYLNNSIVLLHIALCPQLESTSQKMTKHARMYSCL